MSESMSQMFSGGIAEMAEALVAVRRLQNLLEYEEQCPIQSSEEVNATLNKNDAVSIVNLTARWVPKFQNKDKVFYKSPDNKSSQLPPTVATLRDLNVTIKKGMLVGIVGPVGSGKSSILQALMQEMTIDSGSIALASSSVSYASQVPWIYGGTVRQNILFGEPYQRKQYDEVVRVCALLQDFDHFEDGDQTIVGERGASLSGGQRARIK